MPPVPWPPAQPFPESTIVLEAGDTHFPSAAGDREKGKFRPGRLPRTTTVAVTNDDGTEIGGINEELLLELKAIRVGIQLLLMEANHRFNGDLRVLAIEE